MSSPSPNVPGAPANTPVESEQVNLDPTQHDELLEVLASSTASRALGDPTIVPPNSPEVSAQGPPNPIAGIEEVSLGASLVRHESAYTLHGPPHDVDHSTENGAVQESGEGVNGIVHNNVDTVHGAVVNGNGDRMDVDGDDTEVHLRVRARDLGRLSNSVLTLASALETLTDALTQLLQSPEMRARAAEADGDSEVDSDKEMENGMTNGDVVNGQAGHHQAHDGSSDSEHGDTGSPATT
ncbi:MAG: hypothetical protein M1816_008080 [Peltula sp. TS41687]|nr:MAG: hypothetical protein M1816_008080 [Peltula sp. TS41687]